MSRIDGLIQDFCPDGVHFIKIGELAKVGTGSSDRKNATEDGEYPFYVRSKDVMRIDSYEFDEEAILIPGEGGIGEIFHYVNGKYALHQRAYRIHFVDQRVDAKFAYFYFSANFKRFILQKAVSATVTSIRKPMITDFPFPVPPLEVQREIVKILDQFTQLEAELEAELEARRRQYEHYRQLAMSFDDSIPRVALGDIAEVRSGWGFPNAHQGREEGEYPFYKVGDMNLPGNETVMSIANNYVSAEVAKNLGVRPAPAGTVIFPKIGAAVATNKKRVLSVPSAYDNNVMGLVPTERVSSRFLYHWMQTFDLSRLANDSGAVPSIRKTEAEKVLIPLPDLDTQRKVAGLLDKFDALVNDLSVGLPAELAARRKQYEYYRDKLLTFTEAA